ncbi:imidazole glycerol phosphate synthase subunit HisH [Akkermansiaceae bacterium]|nr:imidazole glycerol phosphate synthase subunit HisH [Akkermansiaceae bacterium]MDB4286594.1 imidazole glycerol phosphate synthase subunit HisH [bacterium]MDA7517521.1 imidazole glycerol phosphate synthase subunit HisH [Akkermansiaceae bacterium]MDA7537823.1 imidazole glycerol phosphate synthase subunit HisH [Akkermansiaceae bacterium]MDA7538310.1 imidazole glycerol phosphate synthase subunit HisH [Akkermansiaceae bacterium]
MKLGMIDYGRGNLRSVMNACRALGHEPFLVTKPEDLEGLTHIVFPGQGAFGDCMESLARLELINPLRSWIEADRPYFGICVGFQLLFHASEESPGIAGLGVIDGECRRFKSKDVKIPHMGWNDVSIKHVSSPLWAGFEGDPYFYFVHSFYPVAENESDVAATCHYGDETFCAAIERGNLLATQFHPEKSQHTGLKLLNNFLEG